ncbi:MAG: hypothetical protein GY841_09300 [FCB group bacterium]|nr:hypothetical protein [FCB group bacterium]
MATRRKHQKKTLALRLLNLTGHLACAVFVVLLFLSLVQCTIKKPEAPSWRTNLVVPLAGKTWLMPELIDKLDQENLTTDSLGNPLFYFENVLDTVTIDGSFNIADVSQAVAESLGVISLDPINGSNFEISLGDAMGLPAGIIPDTSYDLNLALPPLGEFANVTIESGFALATISNNMGLNLDTVIVTISDDVYGHQITSYSIPGGIPDGGISVDTVDLAGQTISNQLSMLIHLHTPGAIILSLADKALNSGVGMPAGMQVSAATARIPQITKNFNEAVDIDSDHQLESATLEDGRLVLDVGNNTNLAAELTITMADLLDNGSPLVIIQPVAAGQSAQYIYDLSGYTLEPIDQVMPQSISIDVGAVIDSSGPAMVTISAGDDISVTAGIENIQFGEVNGIIGSTTAEFVDIVEDIDVPTGFDQLQLPAAQAIITVENAVNIPGNFTITIDGNGGQHKVITGQIAAGTPDAPVISTIVESDMSDFMNPIPEQITINGSATYGDGLTSGSITPGDFVVASFLISSPLEMIIDSSTFEGEWEDTKLDIDSSIIDGFKGAYFHGTFVNHLPIGVSAEILLSADSATLYTNPDVRLGPITVEAGELNPDGTVSAPTISQNAIEMDSTEIAILYNDSLWIGEYITFESTNGNSVRMMANDSLSISSYIEVDFNFDSNLWED